MLDRPWGGALPPQRLAAPGRLGHSQALL